MTTLAGEFLSADWGTSSLRLRWVGLQPLRILGEIRGDAGAASVEARAAAAGVDRAGVFAETLRSWIERLGSEAGERIAPDGPDRLLSLPVVVSGMASSSIGWRELPYATLPFPLDGRGLIAESLGLDDHAVHILSGVRGDVDVMRGEETEILGLLSDP
ncbi:MAG TPA: 2-dehydro-3-deoxygalactonokinase, partial [Planctomycetota bacterium]|nr:2-dehydro-3-deoxygalactonokinase [Planctomycetota bacterium]